MTVPVDSLSQISEELLLYLVLTATREGTTLEFKRDSYGGNDEARGEFLADISAFANTGGGDLVIGMDEVDGTATELVGLAGDPDSEILRLQQMALAGIQPQLPTLEIQAIRLSSGRHAIAVRVGRSYNPPHRVIFKGRNRFWVRGPAGRYEPDVDGLRTLFNAGPIVAERIREFRAERLGAINADETPVPLQRDFGRLILHVVPYSAMGGAGGSLDLPGIARELPTVWRAAQSILSFDMTIEGFVTYTPRTAEGCRAYCQVFQSGTLELVFTGIVREKDGVRLISADELVFFLTSNVESLLPLLRTRGASGPCALLPTLVGVKGARVLLPGEASHASDSALSLPRDVVRMQEVVVPEDGAMGGTALRTGLRPLLDQIAQAGGAHAALPQWLKSASKT